MVEECRHGMLEYGGWRESRCAVLINFGGVECGGRKSRITDACIQYDISLLPLHAPYPPTHSPNPNTILL